MSVSKITTPVTENELIGKVNELITKSTNICAFTFSMYGSVESSSVGTNDLMSYDATITPPSSFRYEPANYDYTLVMYPFTEYLTFDARSGYVGYNNNSIYVYFYGNRYKTRGNPSFIGLLIESEKTDAYVASYRKPIVIFPPNSLPTAGFFQATSGSTLNTDGYYETTIGLARPVDRGNATYPVMVAVLNDGHAANYANYATYTYNNSGVTFTLYTKSPSTTSNFYVCCIDADAQMVDFSNTVGSGSKVPTNGTENIASSATFTGADGTNAGSKGLVPAPTATDNDKFLKGDGTWGTPSGGGGGNYVTTDTVQDITAKKTFIGEKAINFKQSAASDKLGFTLYTSSGTELAAFEYRPNTIGSNALMNINTAQSGTTWLGFRYWANINIVAPKPANGTYYIPVNISNGTTTVTANNAGTVNISTLIPTIATSVSSSSTNAETVGAKLFYDTCGDIETLINAL